MTDEEITYLWGMSSNWKEFARAIEAKVREECAVICDEQEDWPAYEAAEAIRGRGKE